MRDRLGCRDRLILPIGQDVDGDEIGGLSELGRLQPELPDIGIGDGKAGAALHLLEIGLDPVGAELAAEQRLVADDEGLDHAGMPSGEPHGAFDLPPIVGEVAADPDALQHLQAVLAGDPRDLALRPRRRIGADAGGDLGELLQIALNLRVGNAQRLIERRLTAVERSVGQAV